jgi:hypothetical protein
MEEGCSTQKQVLNYLGECFRVKLNLPDWYPNEQAAEFLFKYVFWACVCVCVWGMEMVVLCMGHSLCQWVIRKSVIQVMILFLARRGQLLSLWPSSPFFLW